MSNTDNLKKETIYLHERFMRSICEDIAKNKLPITLKGGTALLLCYGLDRHSEDIDLDSNKKNDLTHIIQDAAKKLNIDIQKISLPKDTETVRRYKVAYTQGHIAKSLKIETSLRHGYDKEKTVLINNIQTYKKSHLVYLKIAAFQNRTVARDFHDLMFLANTDINIRAELSPFIIEQFKQINPLFDKLHAAYQDDELLVDLLYTDFGLLEKLHKEVKESLSELDVDDDFVRLC